VVEQPLAGRVAIVTGGARGLGFAAAQLLAERGAVVTLLDRDAAPLEAARVALPGADVVTADVTKPSECDAAVQQVVAKHGRLDILVNCAGIAGVNLPLAEMTYEQFTSVVDVNLFGTFNMCHAAVPAMTASSDPHGRIVNVASMAGKDGNPRASHYSAAKAGIIALTKSLGKELATSGVLVNVIAPAVIETDMASAVTPEQLEYMTNLIPMKRIGQPIEVARLIGFLCSDEVSFSTGAVYDISGGRATY
jgi:3-oxoacyl-[acyl-carrier protein] reductase